MPRLRALVTSTEHKAGDEFEASDADARLLCATDAVGGQKAQLVDRALAPASESETPKQSEPATATNNRRNRYLRRDLRAQS